jgi:hypothetical protein
VGASSLKDDVKCTTMIQKPELIFFLGGGGGKIKDKMIKSFPIFWLEHT